MMITEQSKQITKHMSHVEMMVFFIDLCSTGNLEKTQYFLEHSPISAHTNFPNDLEMALGAAYSYNHLNVIQYFLEHESIKKLISSSTLYNLCSMAATDNKEAIFEYLLTYGQHFHPEYEEVKEELKKESLQIACAKGYLPMIKFLLTSPLLKEKAEFSYHHDYPFTLACRHGQLEVIQYLITEPLLRAHQPLFAKNYSSFHNIKQFIRSFFTPNFMFLHTDTGLQEACRYGQTEVVKYLLTNSHVKHADVYKDHAKAFLNSINHFEVTNYLINDYQIKQTKAIKKHISIYPELKEQFKNRTFNAKLIQDLQVVSAHQIKRVKI